MAGVGTHMLQQGSSLATVPVHGRPPPAPGGSWASPAGREMMPGTPPATVSHSGLDRPGGIAAMQQRTWKNCYLKSILNVHLP
jgi:hypothetical protein